MRTLNVIILASVCFIVSCNQRPIHQSEAANSNATTSASPGLPSGRGTPEEAKAMLAKAVEHYNEAGRDQALADFNKMKSPFGDRDLYVFCLGLNHKVSANGG